jgi:hypothetical protein
MTVSFSGTPPGAAVQIVERSLFAGFVERRLR